MKDKRVLIVGNAPSVTATLRDALLNSDYVIACSGAIQHVPDADMLVSIDGVPPPVRADAALFDGYTGRMLVGVPCERGEHYFMPYEVHGGTHFRNNGISALRIAAAHGATDITLVGFEPERYDAENAQFGYAGLIAAALPAVIAELADIGVTVKYYAPVTKRK